MRVLSRVQSKFSSALVSHRGKKLLQDLLNLDNTTIKRAMVGFRGQREKGAIPSICGMPGGLARAHNEGFPVEGDLRQEPVIT